MNATVGYIVREVAQSTSERSYTHFELVRVTTFNGSPMPDIVLARFNDEREAKAFWDWLQPLVPA